MPDLTEARCDRCGQEKQFVNPMKGANPLPAHQCWNTEELGNDFRVLGFCAPFVSVIRKSDGAKGSLQFTHLPRWYFNWRAHG